MNRIAMTVWVGLCFGGLAAMPALAAEPGMPVGTAVAPSPPPMADEKKSDKAGSGSSATNTSSRSTEQVPIQGDPDLEPQVTLIERDDETHEEVRINGVIRYIKVTPKTGPVYYLVPVNGAAGAYVRRDSLDSGLRVPMWQILSW